jgi:hypothetical protein
VSAADDGGRMVIQVRTIHTSLVMSTNRGFELALRSHPRHGVFRPDPGLPTSVGLNWMQIILITYMLQ